MARFTCKHPEKGKHAEYFAGPVHSVHRDGRYLIETKYKTVWKWGFIPVKKAYDYNRLTCN